MRKKTRLLMLILMILICLSIFELVLNLKQNKIMPKSMGEATKLQYITNIYGTNYSIDSAVSDLPSFPMLSSGMIPVKYEDGYWVITNNEDWNDNGRKMPLYMMLSDKVYQSELRDNMTGKRLASEYVGQKIQEEELGTIYMWCPRYAYNEQGEIIYIKQECSVAGEWKIPSIFTYKTEKTDLSLNGVWVEYLPLSNSSTVTIKINNMEKEDNTYGFISNTKLKKMEEEDKETVKTYIENALETENHGNSIIDLNNTNRTIIQIIDTNKLEPIKAEAYFDTTNNNNIIKINIIYSKYGIKEIIDEDGNKINNYEKEIQENKVYRFIIVDNNNNLKEIEVRTLGNILNYAKGARVTYTSPTPYNCNAYQDINGGYTGRNSPINSALTHSQDSFWGALNNWNTQGSLENDDSKENINFNHEGKSKDVKSSTTIYTRGANTNTTVIINPRAYQGDISKNMFRMSECYLASANSDGNVGKYEIYVSTSSDESVATNPNDPSWILLTKGNLTQDTILTKVYEGGQNFRYIKLVLNSRGKNYMELAAIKVY